MHVQCKTLDFAKDSTSNQLNGIDNRGEIAGSGTPAGGYVIRPPYHQGDYRVVNVPGAVETYVAGINDRRAIAGFYSNSAGDTAGFIMSNGIWTIFRRHLRPVELLGINNSASIVGFYGDRLGNDRAFEADPSRRIEPPGGVSDVAAGINDRGHIVGYMTTARGAVESFLFGGRAYTEFFYPGSMDTTALGINGGGEIVGSYVDLAGATHGFFLTDASTNPKWRSFDEPNAKGFTRLSGINDRGQFVGSYLDASSVIHGFFCSP